MLLPKNEKKLIFIMLLLLVFVATNTKISNYLPLNFQKKLLDNLKTDDKTVNGANTNKQNDKSSSLTVIKVIDGDTIQTSDNHKIRYIGIDAPESKDPRKTVECFAQDAFEKNKQLVLGKTVRLEKDVSETDRFGRLLRYVYVNDVLVNELLVSEGFAVSSAYPPDIKYQHIFDTAENSARDNKKGLWAICSANN